MEMAFLPHKLVARIKWGQFCFKKKKRMKETANIGRQTAGTQYMPGGFKLSIGWDGDDAFAECYHCFHTATVIVAAPNVFLPLRKKFLDYPSGNWVSSSVFDSPSPYSLAFFHRKQKETVREETHTQAHQCFDSQDGGLHLPKSTTLCQGQTYDFIFPR